MWAGAVLVAVAAVGGWAARPDGPPADTSADVGFARAMADHHAQAVEMAELVRFRTNDPEIRLLATDIVLTQQAQIGQMRGWLEAWGRPMTGRGDAMAWMGHGPGAMPGMAGMAGMDMHEEHKKPGVPLSTKMLVFLISATCLGLAVWVTSHFVTLGLK